MNVLNIISAPLVGALVGYITNLIAVRMLFRPLKPVMIGRFRVPFTPGLVPKRKDQLATVLGNAIVEQFFNADDLELVFSSATFADAFADSATALLTKQDMNLSRLIAENNPVDESLKKRVKDEICIRIQAAILRSGISNIVADECSRIVLSRLGSGVSGVLGNLGVYSKIAVVLADNLEKYILNDSRDAILAILDDEVRELSEMKISDISETLFPEAGTLHNLISRLHQEFMSRHSRHIAESVDVGGMITEKVRQMDASSVEVLVYSVVKRELRYITLLGALIGMLIGAINIFI